MSTSITKFFADHAKRVSNCKKCRIQIIKGELRLAKIVPNYFVSDSAGAPELKQYFHPKCLFETFCRARATTKVIESPEDVTGWSDLADDEKAMLSDLIKDLEKQRSKNDSNKQSKSLSTKESKAGEASTSFAKKTDKKVISDDSGDNLKTSENGEATEKNEKVKKKDSSKSGELDVMINTSIDENSRKLHSAADQKGICADMIQKTASKFDSFKLFCKLCDVIAKVSKYTDKSSAVNMFVKKEGYDGNLYLLAKLLLPGDDHRVYGLKAKQLIKLFSNIYSWNNEELIEDLNQSGDVSVTIRKFFEKSEDISRKSHLTIFEVDEWLTKLTEFTTEEKQQNHLKSICKRVSPLELQYILRLVKKDLRINAGAKHILEGIRPGAYEAYQNLRDLKSVIEHCDKIEFDNSVEVRLSLGVPVRPMLAEVCRSVEQAMKRCANGMYSEIKYDGERLQLHKNGDDFTFFSRSLRPVSEHKVQTLREVISKAFPTGNNMILDSEILMVDTDTGKPLPFGTLGIHKKENFSTAVVCLFIFDCLFFNEESLMDRPLRYRKSLLEKNIREIPNRILLSNLQVIKAGEKRKLKEMIWKAIDDGLEGLVLKDMDSLYEPGKRHWLKIKKDYLEDGKMADSADLLVLGAYYGGSMSVFLMGVCDKAVDKYLTVTKCGNGHDDATLARLNKELSSKMEKISKDYEKLPKWIKCSRSLVPDFIIKDPKQAPVWEITGAQFSSSDTHTAMGISIRFPRVTKIREDKTWETATSMEELKVLFESSKQKADFDDVLENPVSLFGKKELNNPCDDNVATNTTDPSKEKKKRSVSDAQLEVLEDSKKRRVTKGEEDMVPVQKKGVEVQKKPCKYGERCYRKNAAHLEAFSHPPKK